MHGQILPFSGKAEAEMLGKSHAIDVMSQKGEQSEATVAHFCGGKKEKWSV